VTATLIDTLAWWNFLNQASKSTTATNTYQSISEFT